MDSGWGPSLEFQTLWPNEKCKMENEKRKMVMLYPAECENSGGKK